MDFCVMCGATLPDECGSQVCRTCEATAGFHFMELNCPECGKPLEIYYKGLIDSRPALDSDEWPYLEVDLIYHCEHCGCDWDSKFVYDWGDISQTKLVRHFWG